MSTRSLVAALFVLAALLVCSCPDRASAQARVYFRIEIGAPVGTASPVVSVQPFGGAFSLSERAALQAMWGTFEGHMTTVARQCEMPVAVEIDAESFRGRMVAGTMDGLHPGTRARFLSLVRALSAVCGRGALERQAVQQRIRAVRFGFRESPEDALALQGDTIAFETNGDMSGRSHMDYSPFIEWIMRSL